MVKSRKAANSCTNFLVLFVLIALIAISGCGYRSTEEDKQEVDKGPYLGTWVCVGIKDGDDVQSLKDYSTFTGRAYSAKMVVRDNGFAYCLEDDDGEVSSHVIPWLKQDYVVEGDEEDQEIIPKGPLYSAGYLELDEQKLLKPFQDGKKLVFEKESDSMGPLLRSAQLPWCKVDVPIELLGTYENESQLGRSNSGEWPSLRQTMMLFTPKPYEGRDLTSASLTVRSDYARQNERPEGEEVAVDGNTFIVPGTTTTGYGNYKTSVYFYVDKPDDIADVRITYLYEVEFNYDEGEKAYYKSYANNLVEHIHPDGDALADIDAVVDSSEQTFLDGGGYEEGPISWQDAPQHIGEYVELCGNVAETNYSPESNGQPTFIDIGEAYPSPNRVTAVIWGENRGNFPESPEVMYEGKYIKVEGELYEHDGTYNIRVTSPSQIVIR